MSMRTISVPSPRVPGSPTSCATTPGASAPTGRSTSRATAGASASRYARCRSPGGADGPASTDAAMRLPEALRGLMKKNIALLYGFSFFDQFMIVIAVWVPYLAAQGIGMRQFMELQAVFALVILPLVLPERSLSPAEGVTP